MRFAQTFLITLLILIHVINPVAADELKLEGYVKDKKTGEPLIGANVMLKDTKLGSPTDKDGKFVIHNVPHGDYILIVSYVGYKEFEQHVHVDHNQQVTLEILIDEDVFAAETIVVTATRTKKTIRDVPIRTEVIPEAVLENAVEASAIEILGKQPGIQMQIDCSACNTAGIKINGLGTQYSKVLIDGMPSIGGLSNIYGLWNLSTGNMKQIEIVKGASSALYGSDAIAGTINIITKEPTEFPILRFSVQTSSKESKDFNFVTNRITDDWGLTVTGNYNQQNMLDENNDTFSEYAEYKRFGGSAKFNYNIDEKSRASFSGDILYEDRVGGSVLASRHDIGTSDLFSKYLESIITERQVFKGTYSYDLSSGMIFSTKGQIVNHDQDSYYGTRHYLANQKIYYAEATIIGNYNDYEWLAGATFTNEHYEHELTSIDETSIYDYDYNIPGLMAQIHRDFDRLNSELVLSGRYDHHSEHGNVWTPRIALKINPVKDISWRVSYGTGFRVANPVTEEHGGLTGLIHFQPNTNLDPEKSNNVNSNLTFNFPGTNHAFKVELGGHYTKLDNFIIDTFTETVTSEGPVIVRSMKNGEGSAWVRGFDLNLSYLSTFGLDVSLGYGFLNSEIEEEIDDGVLEKHEFFYVPRHRLTLDLLYDIPVNNLKLNLRGQFNGSQMYDYINFPDRVSKNERTPSYSLWDLKLDIPVQRQFTLFVGADNLFDYTQQSEINPLVTNSYDSNNDDFQPTGFIWGPLQGRKVFLGLRVNY